MIFDIVDQKIAQSRYDICKSCHEFNSLLHTCKLCGCLMKLKVKLNNSVCPLKKWN